MNRVLAPIHAPLWGGLHTIAERVAPLSAEHGWPWTVVLPAGDGDNGRDRLERAGVRVVEIPLRRVRRSRSLRTQGEFVTTLPLDSWRLARLARRERATVVQVAGLLHVHGAIAATGCGLPLVWQLHSDQPPARLRRLLTPVVVALADSVMTSGAGMVASHPGLDRAGDRLLSFTAPVDVQEFRPDLERRARARTGFGAGEGDVVVGIVGGRGPNKNHRMLVEVAIETAATHPHVKYAICGPWLEQHRASYEADVIGLARRHGLLDRGIVTFHEPEDQVSTYLDGFDLFALTSLGEGASIVTAEALASGVPVLVNDVGSLRDSVAVGRSGYVNESNSVDELARYVLELADDPTRRAAFGHAAREIAEQRFSNDACADVHIVAYEAAVEARRARTRWSRHAPRPRSIATPAGPS